jgi:hypothetical protein
LGADYFCLQEFVVDSGGTEDQSPTEFVPDADAVPKPRPSPAAATIRLSLACSLRLGVAGLPVLLQKLSIGKFLEQPAGLDSLPPWQSSSTQ